MVFRKNTLLKNYLNYNFITMNKSLYNQYYYYMLILIGFSVMFVSVLLRFDHLVFNKTNIIIIGTILFPVIYLLAKSFKGLLLLNDAYQNYHFQLIRQFLLLYIWAYNILIASLMDNFFTTSFIYFSESLIVYLFAYLFYRFTEKYKRIRITQDIRKFNKGYFFEIEKYNPIKETIVFAVVILLILLLGYKLVLFFLNIQFLYYIVTYFFMVIISYSYLYERYNEPYISLEIELMNLGLNNYPNELIASLKENYLNINKY